MLLSHLQWIRILVKFDGRTKPGSSQVVVGSSKKSITHDFSKLIVTKERKQNLTKMLNFLGFRLHSKAALKVLCDSLFHLRLSSQL